MKQIAIAASVGAILIGAYSFVYACSESKSKQTAKARTTPRAAAWYAADASIAPQPVRVIDDKVVLCKTVASVDPIAIEVDVPAEAFQMTRRVHIRGAAVQHPETDATPVDAVRRSVKVAATLGRALVTTVGAVFGTLVDAVIQATSSLV